MSNRDQVKPIYQELQGYLQSIPTISDLFSNTNDQGMWERYNQSIEELNKIVVSDGKDYSKFLIKPITNANGGSFIRLLNLKNSISGIIDRIHGDYFTDESRPFTSSPSTVISQTQSQSIDIVYVLNIQENIISSLKNPNLEPKEKQFLEKVKAVLGTTKNTLELFAVILKIASEFGLNPTTIKTLLGL